MTLPACKTKIVATIGPASITPDVMQAMIRAGLNVARLNFSHGDFETHDRVIRNLRDASAAAGRDIAILADLPGPKMRIGSLVVEPLELKTDEVFTLSANAEVSEPRRVGVTFPKLPLVVQPGDTLYLNDGIIQLEVIEVRGPDVVCRVVAGGELRSRKGLNLPGINLGMSAFTDRDHDCLQFALARGVDAISQSFVNSADDIHAVRQAAQDLGYRPFIIAKIERRGALDQIDPILDAADGIMIARGDLGVEVPIERIAVLQKQLTHKARWHGKPVITATQMLESMTHSRQPTRAEATDVANAILDGTDCVMLSGESAMGRYPVEAVATLARIAAATEPHRPPLDVWPLLKDRPKHRPTTPADHLALAIDAIFRLTPPAAVMVPTRSGATARNIGRFRLPVWLAAISSNRAVCRSLNFSYGIVPILAPNESPDWSQFARDWIRTNELSGHLAVLVQGPSAKNPEANHQIELIDLLPRQPIDPDPATPPMSGH